MCVYVYVCVCVGGGRERERERERESVKEDFHYKRESEQYRAPPLLLSCLQNRNMDVKKLL